MVFRRFPLLNSLLVMLLFVSTNHCLLESFFESKEIPQTSSNSSDCSSHSKEDPESHSEGQPCSATVFNVVSQNEIRQLAISTSFVNLIHSFSVLFDANLFQDIDFSLLEVPDLPLDHLLVSLTISSNAPPALA